MTTRPETAIAGDGDCEYTSVDLNATGATTLYSPSAGDATVTGVYLLNSGGTADVRLEVTDGTNTSVLADPGAGNSITFEGDVNVSSDDSVQVNVETAEGSALSETAVVSRVE